MIDSVSGAVTHRLFIDGGVFGPIGRFRLANNGVEMGHQYERLYSIHPDDPNSAKAVMVQTYELGRAEWQVRIECGAVMTSTVSSFETTAWLEAFSGSKSITRREWQSSIPRLYV
jgi:hypothetical protein